MVNAGYYCSVTAALGNGLRAILVPVIPSTHAAKTFELT
jgi:hypothetical protein